MAKKRKSAAAKTCKYGRVRKGRRRGQCLKSKRRKTRKARR